MSMQAYFRSCMDLQSVCSRHVCSTAGVTAATAAGAAVNVAAATAAAHAAAAAAQAGTSGHGFFGV